MTGRQTLTRWTMRDGEQFQIDTGWLIEAIGKLDGFIRAVIAGRGPLTLTRASTIAGFDLFSGALSDGPA